MPGNNHDVVASFMDTLPLPVREAATDLICYSSLKEMLSIRQEGPTEFLQNRFNLSPEEWQQVVNAVIMTKVSYFQIELNFPNRYIDKLIEIACYAHGMPSNDPTALYQSVLSDHPSFAMWIKNAIQMKQQNLRLAQKQNS
ncbi:hypothetical protein [Thiomicrorhabdus lithotrophica]|uniref:Uncharacterized protein n=1 Tax=Thiomicrorhabdus lithotrophica TaxID=2949997 RepID=A0ABY8CCS1_9GAMM|nr:hypothetical protein [Thiomicrorhabdus lithotrophica]WEJ62341.1 hypothetical protein NR989_10010 [Thiomicrorhabdus lithotrophica]